MAKFDTIALEPWAKFRAGKVKNNTIKRDFTFITSFTQFCALTRNNYCKALTNNMVEEKPDSWLPFDKNELELIFSNLPISDKDENWEFWIPLIGLYTGGRISEISALRIDNFKTIMNIEVYHLPGTKTDASPRDLPIHPDLIDIGLLSLVEKRRNEGKERLFDIKDSPSNGAGARPSKDFRKLTRTKLKITNDRKVFHSFRHLITHHLIQVSSDFMANTQYTWHTKENSVKVEIYGTNINLDTLKKETIDKMDWNKFIGWSPDLISLKKQANSILIRDQN